MNSVTHVKNLETQINEMKEQTEKYLAVVMDQKEYIFRPAFVDFFVNVFPALNLKKDYLNLEMPNEAQLQRIIHGVNHYEDEKRKLEKKKVEYELSSNEYTSMRPPIFFGKKKFEEKIRLIGDKLESDKKEIDQIQDALEVGSQNVSKLLHQREEILGVKNRINEQYLNDEIEYNKIKKDACADIIFLLFSLVVNTKRSDKNETLNYVIFILKLFFSTDIKEYLDWTDTDSFAYIVNMVQASDEADREIIINKTAYRLDYLIHKFLSCYVENRGPIDNPINCMVVCDYYLYELLEVNEDFKNIRRIRGYWAHREPPIAEIGTVAILTQQNPEELRKIVRESMKWIKVGKECSLKQEDEKMWNDFVRQERLFFDLFGYWIRLWAKDTQEEFERFVENRNPNKSGPEAGHEYNNWLRFYLE